MSKLEKLLEKLRGDTRLSWVECESLLLKLGFEALQGSGSRVKFFRRRAAGGSDKVFLHKPHPRNELDAGAQADLKEKLEDWGDL